MEARQPPHIEMTEPLVPRSATCSIPLTGSQKRWLRYVSEQNGRNPGTIAAAIRIRGSLDAQLLCRAVEAVVLRHESLRTRIICSEGAQRQHVDPPCGNNLTCFDLSRTANSEQEARRLAEAFASERIDIAAGPLFKSALLQLSAHEHVLALVADHVISDAVSLSIISREIWKLYDLGVNGHAFSLPELRVQFPDYAVWQDRTFERWRALHEQYWRERLCDAPRTQIPHDAESGGESPSNRMLHIPFGKQLSDGLREMARCEAAPLPLIVLTIYVLAMALWCQRRDLLVGFISHGRHALPELKDMVGYVSTSVSLRVQMSDADLLIDLWRRIRAESDNAFAHYDFDRVCQIFPECATDLMFNWIAPPSFRASTDAKGGASRIAVQPFPLSLSWTGGVFVFFADTPAGIVASVTYAPDRISSSSLDRFGRHLRGLAQALLQQPLATFASVIRTL